MKPIKIVGIVVLVIVAMVALSFALGYLDVGYTKTVGKAKQNAETEVFYETKSYIGGKKQDALKYYDEYRKADINDREAIKMIVKQQFAEFDEQEHLTEPLKTFIYDCKYK